MEIAVIIVTHNSQAVLGRCLADLQRQSRSCRTIIVVDAGSSSTAYLDALRGQPEIQVLTSGPVGFSRANNIGYSHCPAGVDYVVFLNPDAFLDEHALATATACMEKEPEVGCLTGRLLGYDMEADQPSGLIDSTGIFRAWYGRWYDRGQGLSCRGQYATEEDVPAACGAFMFCRKAALDSVALPGDHVFDPDFFLYKEDIELSLRFRAFGYRIRYHPHCIVYHCRGWQRNRRRMAYALRVMAAANEVRLYCKHPSVYMMWAVSKYLSVRLLRL
ncbi:glycosyltransferase family 2 protein [Desulfobulbus alkaliphilus]|uniref:glycosyltransferase family 2 protein n=1 Tax=Desulfobulbus alkaliphilus TaxID=869814 RepID=UPI0019635CE7|nr:glycosyltransferase family 2 protein [Desulfobulbus alkaliphilus]MBM9537987.1 glycosyltransferase family 2 protein [Desulfobulbus alkaliphilus]